MRKIIVQTFVTLDGVMQAPGGPEEDETGSFKFGGWQAPYVDQLDNKLMQEIMAPADLLLGRTTFDIFASYWPKHADMWPGINEVTKYCVSKTKKKSDWNNSEFLHTLADIKKLKSSKGSDLKVWGSSQLIQTLLKNDLVDEMWLITHPLTLGQGKKLFREGTIPAAFTLVESKVTPKGVIFAHYKRAGKVKTGIIGE